jgi:4-hydroxythreonine-4-phosphate dehydrogenase
MYTKLTNSTNTMTLFVTGNLRVFFLTRHIPLSAVSAAMDEERIVEALGHCQNYLRQLGLQNPVTALAALNPHASDQGLFGNEERDILNPAVQKASEKGIGATGPVPADSVFHLAKEGHYDAVLSLYHDQGHIAAKTLDFYGTVSLTMGLPFLRTSVDHGTAMEIAGKNISNEKSMVEAIKSAAQLAW